MKITLKEKHLCFIVSHLSGTVLSRSYALVDQIRYKLKNTVGLTEDSLIEININPNDFDMIYAELGQKGEGLVSGINREMKLLLSPQIADKINAMQDVIENGGTTVEDVTTYSEEEQSTIDDGVDAMSVAEKIQAREAIYDSQITREIENGRSLLFYDQN